MLEGILDALARGIGAVPPAVFVLILLGGPTLAYFVWQFLGGGRASRGIEHGGWVGVPVEAEFWQCPDCLSLTPFAQRYCYACGLEAPGEDELLEDEPAPATADTIVADAVSDADAGEPADDEPAEVVAAGAGSRRGGRRRDASA